jgi:hypothetical protein
MQWKDSGGGEYEQPPVGSHIGICVRVIDLGTQEGQYQGKPTSKRQCMLTFETPNELMSGENEGKPFLVSKFYTASLGEKANLRHDLENWRGRAFTPDELAGFDSKNVLGKACMLSLTKNDKDKVRITGVMAMPKGMAVAQPMNPLVYFSLDEYDAGAFNGLSDGIKKMIALSPEYKRATRPPESSPAQSPASGNTFAEMDDDIPF